ncbi:SRPBCC family protein [Variovorax soli]|uniref:SRPBCC family protein n=1 Tax=Variovorax soli TaxID=376815 RepID=UPI00083828D7|nr:SRPBCC family protein [Variovorax soli]
MNFEERIDIKAPTEVVFALYSDVDRWASWDPDVKSSSIHGAFATGSIGRLKPTKGPEAKIVFSEVIPLKSFTVQSKLPLCMMQFEHELATTAMGTTALHRVSFSGFLAPIFGRLIGKQIRKGLPKTMAGLKRAAESC